MFKTYIPKPYIPELGAYRSKNYKILENFIKLNAIAAEYIPEEKVKNLNDLRKSFTRTASYNGFPVIVIYKNDRIFFIREDIGEDD